VIIELGRFKAKDSWYPHCSRSSVKYEEKETDVAISVKLIELFLLDGCDTAMLVHRQIYFTGLGVQFLAEHAHELEIV
jgi:hypothetical protein